MKKKRVEVSESSTEVDETVIEEEATDGRYGTTKILNLKVSLKKLKTVICVYMLILKISVAVPELDREAGEKYRAQSLITNFLPAIDNFERAMQIEPDNEQAKSLLNGVEMVYRSIIEALIKKVLNKLKLLDKNLIRICTKLLCKQKMNNSDPILL